MAGLSFLKGTRALVKSFIARVTSDGGIIEAAKCIGDLDASLVMQPSGYKAETLYSQKPVPVYGSELVTNGDFATDLSNWNIVGSSVVWDNGKARITTSSAAVSINQTVLPVGFSIIQIDVIAISGSIKLLQNSSSIIKSNLTSGSYSIRWNNTTGSVSTLNIFRDAVPTDCYIDNVSVKEVLTGSGDFTVDRNSTATRVNSLGLIESVAANVPRLDYTDGNCPSLLLEPQSTNLITYSEDFSNAYWLKQSGGTGSNPIVTSNQGISPDGTNTADRVVFNSGGTSTGSNFSTLASSVISPSILNNRSVYLKSFDGSNYDLFIGSNSPNAAGITVTITSEWQRFDVNHTPSSSTTNIYLSTRALFGGTPSNTADVLVWGAQLEQSSVATSYIPTSGTTVTRLADVVGGAGDASTFNDSEGVLFFEGARLLGSSNSVILSVNNGSVNNSVAVYYFTTGVRVDIFNSSGTRSLSFTMSLENQSLFNKIAIKYKSNDIALWVNGVEVAVNNQTLSLSGLNQISFDYGNGNFDFYGKTKDLQYYNTALTDERLIYITGTLNENYYNTYFDMSNALNYTPQ
jgi:hypothetical protein